MCQLFLLMHSRTIGCSARRMVSKCEAGVLPTGTSKGPLFRKLRFRCWGIPHAQQGVANSRINLVHLAGNLMNGIMVRRTNCNIWMRRCYPNEENIDDVGSRVCRNRSRWDSSALRSRDDESTDHWEHKCSVPFVTRFQATKARAERDFRQDTNVGEEALLCDVSTALNKEETT